MSTLDLKCGQSFSFPPRSAVPTINRALLSLGDGYQTFLYLEFPPCIGLNSLKQARLILFKRPSHDLGHEADRPCERYALYPLMDFFSVYGYLYSPPHVDHDLKVEFVNDPHRCALEIDITAIADAWLGGVLENKGLMLTGNKGTRRISFASDQVEMAGMRPMIRLVLEEVTICQPLSMQCCVVTMGASGE